MDKFGIIGYPLGHSKSPAAFGAAYHGKWPFDLIEGKDFEALWGLFLKEYKAVNITAPYKELAYAKSDIITPEVEMIHATNLVIKTAEGIKAFNSDFRGVKQCILNAGFKAGDTALIVGAGGAGKAAAAAAKDLGLRTAITNRTLRKAEAMAEFMGLELLPFNESQSVDLLIYTVPGPIDGVERFSGRAVLEACYANPTFTKAGLEAKGSVYIDGKEWHYQQAVAGYGLMTGEEPDREATREAYNF